MFTLDTSALQEQLKAKAKRIEAGSRVVAQAGAHVLYEQVLNNVPVGEEGHWFYGTHSRYWFDAGNLKASIYQVYSKDNSSEGRATYHISWNHQKAPYGFMVENGTSRAAAHPFLRPAQDQAGRRAIEAMEATLEGLVDA